jgi:hypothetical protein
MSDTNVGAGRDNPPTMDTESLGPTSEAGPGDGKNG